MHKTVALCAIGTARRHCAIFKGKGGDLQGAPHADGSLAEKSDRRNFSHFGRSQSQDGPIQAWNERYQALSSARNAGFCFCFFFFIEVAHAKGPMGNNHRRFDRLCTGRSITLS